MLTWRERFFVSSTQRKMMAVLILSVRTGTPPDVIDEVTGDLLFVSNSVLLPRF